MGVEVQLFYVKLEEAIDFNKLDDLLQKLGCVKRPSYDDEQNYEIFSEKGIIELQVMNIYGNIKNLFIRFSFGNPITVIDKTFSLFNEISEKLPIEIFDSESMERISLTNRCLSRFKKIILEKKKFFDLHYMKINKPIRGGKETFDYIRKHKNELN